MHRGAVTPELLRKSVLAVPPLARRADHTLDETENRRLLDHLRAGGVFTFLYGGNANLYNMGVREFAAFLDLLESMAQPGDWMIPSIGADFGKASDQIDILKDYAFPTAMLLPLRSPMTPRGIARGIGRLAERFGRPLIAYVKDDGFITAEDLGALVRDGAVCAVKYAVVRADPAEDRTLAEILEHVHPALVVSGIGERPVGDHASRFGLKAFTSGSVCIAPVLSSSILDALQTGDIDRAMEVRRKFIPLEDLRDRYSPLRVLHEAVRLAGICDSGPIQPFLSAIDDSSVLSAIAEVARKLLDENGRAGRSVRAEAMRVGAL